MNARRPLGLPVVVLSILFVVSPASAASEATVGAAPSAATPSDDAAGAVAGTPAAYAAPETSPSVATEPVLREVGAWAAAGQLDVELSAGSVRIVPGAADRVRVLAPVDTDDDENVDLRARYSIHKGEGRLQVRARDELVVTIEVPPSVGLVVRMSAGELHVGPIVGDKDLRLAAGELVLRAADGEQDADVQLRVMTGEIQWKKLGVERGGLFRSYQRDGAGPRLRARVTAGELRII
jgi:hypothetical protein